MSRFCLLGVTIKPKQHISSDSKNCPGWVLDWCYWAISGEINEQEENIKVIV